MHQGFIKVEYNSPPVFIKGNPGKRLTSFLNKFSGKNRFDFFEFSNDHLDILRRKTLYADNLRFCCTTYNFDSILRVVRRQN